MAERQSKAEHVFSIALELSSPGTRAAYLDQICGEDRYLRRRVAALLRSHAESQRMLDEPATALELARSADDADGQVGARIGPYKLLEQLGEGGMGVVYVARQDRPVRRKVALKIIKPGMDTKEVIARFEAERQTLAIMDHPHIAQALGAGATQSGHPYFAMELVRGIPITDYCDRQRLNIGQRLQLFATACQAIQHAHQKGVIHRDVKPSNILVGELDGRPLLKVIDFGLAKALNQRLTERTIHTRYQQMIGTPLYMSPEQTDPNAMDVDTRSDVYSLGVLLYELLTGVTPFDPRRIRAAPYDELRRIIREEEPPQPSTRINMLGDRASSITELRQSDSRQLFRQLRGELDWIVMKALDKDPSRRYESANGLAADVQRYLEGQPVGAGPPSSCYQFRKFAHRHRGPLITAAAIGTVLLLAAGISVSQARVALKLRKRAIQREAQAQTQRDLAVSLLEDLKAELRERASRAILAGDEAEADVAIEEAERAGVSGELITLFRGQLALYYGKTADAVEKLKKVADTSVAAMAMLTYAYIQLMDLESGDIPLANLTRLVQMLSMSEMTFEDKLFAGQTLMNTDIELALKLVQEALRENSGSPLAQMVHAQTLAAFAHNRGDTSKISLAMAEINNAMHWVGGVPEMLTAHHLVECVALRAGVREKAAFDLDQLHSEWETVNTLPMGRVMLIRMLAHLDDPLVPELIESVDVIKDGEMSYYAPILLLYWDPERVLRFLQSREVRLYGKLAEARVTTLIPGMRDHAEKLCSDLAHQHPHAFPRAACLNTLLLLGQHDRAQQLARELRNTSSGSINYAREIMQFLDARGETDQFLSGTDGNRLLELEARFTVAMLQLVEREPRETVLQSLRQCVATECSHSETYWWARSFVRSAEHDLGWTFALPSE